MKLYSIFIGIFFNTSLLFSQSTENSIKSLFDESYESNDSEVKKRLRIKIAADSPDSPYGLFARAWLSDSPEESLRLYTEAIEKKADFWEAYKNRGLVYQKRGDYKSSVEDFKEVLKLNPKAKGVEFNIAIGLTALYEKDLNEAGVNDRDSDLHEALDYINASLKKDADDGQASWIRGYIKSYLGDYRGGVEDFNKALNQQPKNEVFLTARAWAFFNLKMLKESQRDAEKAISINPKYMFSYMIRGQVKINRGDKIGGCKDLSFAGENGFKRAYELIREYCQ